MQRRRFISTLGTLTGGLLLSKPDFSWAEPDVERALTTTLDRETFWNVIRQQFVFPQDYTYLNTGGIGAAPTPVLNQVKTAMNVGEIYPSPGYDHEKWMCVKEKCTSLLSSDCKKEEIALTNTATEGINIILNGLPLKKGDEVITSTHEHAALNVPLLNRMQRDGIVIRTFEPDSKDGLDNVARIESLIRRRTRLIFVSHVTCTTGQIFPIREIGNLARTKGIWFGVDGAQAPGAIPMDIVKCNIDFYACSGHKWILGPKRTGILYVREDLLDTLRPITVGAYSDDGFDLVKGELAFQPTAQRYEYGTQNESLYRGLGKAIDFINTIGLKTIKEHNRSLSERFYAGLTEIPGIQISSPAEEKFRSSMITFHIRNKNYKDIAKHLSERRIRVRQVPEADLKAIRVSFHIYNNTDEVDKVLHEIKSLALS